MIHDVLGHAIFHCALRVQNGRTVLHNPKVLQDLMLTELLVEGFAQQSMSLDVTANVSVFSSNACDYLFSLGRLKSSFDRLQ